MSSRAIVPLDLQAQRIGARIIETLCRLGFEHKNQDGRTFYPTFSDITLYGDIWAVYGVDASRLYRYSVVDLGTDKVATHLSAVLHLPVKALRRNGLFYVVELRPRPKPKQLPKRAMLDLDQRPGERLSVPIGVGDSGAIWRNLDKLGHTLITGTTGAGKSTWLHSALAALLTANTPDMLQVALVDPKRSELQPWAAAPHLISPIAYDDKDTARLLALVADEVNARGDLFASVGARDIAAYNRKAAEPMPYLLVVVDEILDFAGDKDIAESLKAIARRGRGAGVILWAATQHAAAVSGLPRLVNVNLTTRLVFRVTDRSAADTAGCIGAQDIARDKPGRMLAKLDGAPQEVQAYYLSDDQLATIARTVSQNTNASGLVLSDFERDLVKFAWYQLGGGFVVNKLAEQFHKGKGSLADLAGMWEARGWLTPQAARNDPRKVTNTLLDLAGLVPAEVGHDLGHD